MAKIVNNSVSRIFAVCIGALLTKVVSVAKISLIVGTHHFFFTPNAICIPLFGRLGSAATSFWLMTFLVVLRTLTTGNISLHTFAFYVPGFCAALYWARPTSFVRLVLPLACVILFTAHPVGRQAFAYALYWLIPIGLFFVPRKPFFADALSSTFIAHAVGSVIWIYTMPMCASVWLGLIPVVALERFIFASGMTLIEYGFAYLCEKVGRARYVAQRYRGQPCN
jgi:hypothetical protein